MPKRQSSTEGEGKTISYDDLKRIFQSKDDVPDTIVDLCFCKRKVKIYPLKVKDKKNILKSLGQGNEDLIDSAFDSIIEKYVEPVDDEPFDIEDLKIQERYQLLAYIRVNSGEGVVKVNHRCPECGEINEGIELDLENLNETHYKEEDEFVEILGGKVFVKLAPVSRKTEKLTEKYAKKMKVKDGAEKTFMSIASTIDEIYAIDGDDNRVKVEIDSFEQKYEFFENLPSSELDKILEKAKKFDFGITISFDFKCEHCEHEKEGEEIPVSLFFIS